MRPGLVIVGLIVLVFGGCLLVPSSPQQPTPATGGASTSGAGPTTTVALPPVPAEGPTFQGPVRLAELMSFSSGEPLTGQGSAGSLLRWTNDRLRFSVSGWSHDGARWGGASTPTYDQCVAAVNQQPMSQDEMEDMAWRNNEGYCFRTGNRKVIVFVRTGDREGEALNLDAVVWKYRQPN